MKNYLKWNHLLSVTVLLSLGMLTACEDDDPSGGDDVEVGTFTATVDDVDMDFSTGINAIESPMDPEWYMIAGADLDNNTTIVMNIPGAAGSYDFGGQDDPVLVITVEDEAWAAINGTLNLTTLTDSNLAGAFSGTLTDDQFNTISVDDGVFNVAIVQVDP